MARKGIKVGCIMRECVYNYNSCCMKSQIQINENTNCLSYRKVYVPDCDMLGLKAKQLQSIGEDCVIDDIWSEKLAGLKTQKTPTYEEIIKRAEHLNNDEEK